MRFTRLAAFVLGSLCTGLSAAACAPLPEFEKDVCGNMVIDEAKGEECDGHVQEGLLCGAPEADNECRYLCDASNNRKCPLGAACGRDGLCRRSTGEFEHYLTSERFASPGRLYIGDFDVDGTSDVLMLGQADSFGNRPARLVHPTRTTVSEERPPLPAVIGPPAIGDVEDDDGGTDDIAFGDPFGVALLLGRPRQSPEFAVYPFVVPEAGTHVRGVLVDALPQETGVEVVTLVDRKGEPASLMAANNGQLVELTQFPASGEDRLAGPMVVAQLDENAPCPQIVLAFRDRKDVQVFTPCREGVEKLEWNASGEATYLSLPFGVDARPQVADLDLDGHLDVIVGANDEIYVAWGNGDGTFSSKKKDGALNAASPYALPQTPWSKPSTYPLAVADLNADGVADFVLPNGVLMSSPQGYGFAFLNLGVEWTEAVIADFNGNGSLDIIAGSSDALDLDFLNNAGGGALNPATVATEGFIAHLTVGDFDGDLLNDVVFEQTLEKDNEDADYLAIAFGAPFGPPASVGKIGHLDDIEQITTGRLVLMSGFDAIDDILVFSEDAQADRDVLSLFTGRSSRSIYAPASLSLDGAWRCPLALAFGFLGDPTPDIAALTADYTTGRLQLLRIDGAEDGPELAPPSAPLSGQFHPAEGNQISFRYGAVMAGGDLDEDRTDEFVIVAPTGPFPGRASLVIAHYDQASGSFTTEPEREVEAALSVDSSLALHDVDGDGHLDAVLTTGTAELPGELLIFWGNAMNNLNVERAQRISPGGQGVRAAACLPSRTGKGCELLLATPGGTYRFAPGAGASLVESLKGVPVYAFGVADFDRDNLADIAVQTDQGLDIYRVVPKE